MAEFLCQDLHPGRHGAQSLLLARALRQDADIRSKWEALEPGELKEGRGYYAKLEQIERLKRREKRKGCYQGLGVSWGLGFGRLGGAWPLGGQTVLCP